MGGQNFNDTSWIDDYAERMMKDKKFVEQTYAEVQTGKLFQALESQVRLPKSPSALKNLQKNCNIIIIKIKGVLFLLGRRKHVIII